MDILNRRLYLYPC